MYETWADYEWQQHQDYVWRSITFNEIAGDEELRSSNLSRVEIPVAGIYTVIAAYHWHSTDRWTAPETAIAINTPENSGNCYLVHHLLPNGCAQKGTLNYTDHFKKGDKIMLSIKGYEGAEYFLNDFLLRVKKIN